MKLSKLLFFLPGIFFFLFFSSTKTFSLEKKKDSPKPPEKKAWDEEVDKLYEAWNRKETLQSMEILKKKIKEKPGEAKAYWRLCRSLHWLYDHEKEESQKIQYALQGIEYSKKGIQADSQSGPCYFYHAVMLGLYSQHYRLSSLGRIEQMFISGKRAAELDPSFDHGAPHRLLGYLYLEAPSMVGGDLDRSVFHFERACHLSPDLAENLLGLAKAYLQKGYGEVAKVLLKKILAEKKLVDPEEVLQQVRKEAKQLLKQQ